VNIINVGYDSTNYYALDMNGGKLLIDCGWPGTLPKLSAALRRKGSALQEIRCLLVTHFHPDHAGIAQDLRQAGAHLLLMESQPGFVAPMEEIFRRRGLSYLPLTGQGNMLLGFGESRAYLSQLGINGEILATPGHSDDSVTLVLDEGLAFTGDLTPPFALPEDDLTSRSSWTRIFEHGVTRVFPAHGNPWGPAQ
jgi:glyoxylase-like metal-dependent hydrolase (beta-lactamase superfamily II)